MLMKMTLKKTIASFLILFGTEAAALSFTDKALFDQVTGGGTTVDFTGLNVGEALTDQIAGIEFASGTALAHLEGQFNDNRGFRSDGNETTIFFNEDQTFFGATRLGPLSIELINFDGGGETIVESAISVETGTNLFLGIALVSETFNRVRLFDDVTGPIFVDDIQFGVAEIPVPPMLPLYAGIVGVGFAFRKFARPS